VHDALETVVRRARLSYRARLADRVDALLALGDDGEFRAAWSSVSAELTWNHRPTARRLWELARLRWPGTVVEIGSFEGNSTIYLAMAGREVHAVDPHSRDSMSQLAGSVADSDPSDRFLRNLERFGVLDRVVYHRTDSAEAAETWTGEQVSLLFVDGMHTYDAVRSDYLAWRPLLAREHVVLFDDYLWAPVQHAVDDLRAEERCSHFYLRGGQAIFSTSSLPLRVVGLP
jgi:predicted O-methyltransferase YrrM